MTKMNSLIEGGAASHVYPSSSDREIDSSFAFCRIIVFLSAPARKLQFSSVLFKFTG